MVNTASSALNIGPRGKITSLAFTLALQNLEEVCQQIADLDLLYAQRRRELLDERNEMIRDAANNRVAIRHLQHVSGLSRNRIYQLRAEGSDE
ncbi:hypothetical protein [Amnibacterium endophyticum]|uniref:Uncharacterized protein n=1 Tax=Amnibacterium endophyticum TaxID=2109337 RepID=A0ABW4LCR7_9MICO